MARSRAEPHFAASSRNRPERPLDPRNLVEVGINGWLNSKLYRDYARDHGITVIPARDVHRRGIDDVISRGG